MGVTPPLYSVMAIFIMGCLEIKVQTYTSVTDTLKSIPDIVPHPFPFLQLYRGYFGVNKVGSSFKEAFEIGRDMPKDDPDYESSFPISENNVWPEADEGQDNAPYVKFKETMMHYHSLLLDVSLDLLRLVALGLGLKETYFDTLFTKNISTLRLINYPVHNFEIPKDAYGSDGKLLSTAQHRDTSILTLLTTFDYEGLQVRKGSASYGELNMGFTYILMFPII